MIINALNRRTHVLIELYFCCSVISVIILVIYKHYTDKEAPVSSSIANSSLFILTERVMGGVLRY